MSAVDSIRHPASDTVVYATGGVSHSYGPRVDIDGHVEPPQAGLDPEFWGVYRLTDTEWQWVIDVPTKAEAEAAAAAGARTPVQAVSA